MSETQWTEALRRWGQRLGKFKYPLLIFLLGLALVAIPTRPKAQPDAPPQTTPQKTSKDALLEMEEKLEQILSQIQGAGQVQVMLELAAGEKTIFQMDSSQEVSTQEDTKQTKTENKTVLASGTGTGGAPVAVQTLHPTYRGALVVSEGADSATVRLDLASAVASITGLGADKITVVKMKRE